MSQTSSQAAGVEEFMFMRIRAIAQARLLAAEEHRRLILEAHESGISVRRLAAAVNERPGTVHVWIKAAREERSTLDRGGAEVGSGTENA